MPRRRREMDRRKFAASPFARLAGLGLLLAILTIALYEPIARHPFVNYDDGDYIVENPHIQSGLDFATVKWAVTAAYAANWHPFTWIVHALDFQIYGMDAGGHHFTSVMFHAANVVLFFLLFAAATRSIEAGFFAAAIFAVHPLNVESVVWAAELKNLLCTFFVLLAAGAYGWYACRPAVGRYILVVLLFVLALASKPMAITLPFVFLLLDFWPLSRIQKIGTRAQRFEIPQSSSVRLIVEKLPLFAFSAASAWITVRAQTAGNATNMIEAPLGSRLANALVACATYIEKMFIPTNLAPFYPFPVHGIPAWQIVVSALALLGISALVFRYRLQRPYLITGWLWFLGTLVPVLGIVQVGAQARADRYVYIPMMGLLVIIGLPYFETAAAKKWSMTARIAPLAIAIVILAVVSVRQISYWGSSYALWTHTIAVTTPNATAEHNLSTDLIRSGRIDEALPHIERAVELNPNDLVSRVNLGNAYLTRGQLEPALGQFVIVLQHTADPKLVLPASINAGLAYLRLQDFANADAAYRQALRISPNNPTALIGIAAVARAHAATSPAAKKE
jgi:protein O-mannosyl-transferase